MREPTKKPHSAEYMRQSAEAIQSLVQRQNSTLGRLALADQTGSPGNLVRNAAAAEFNQQRSSLKIEDVVPKVQSILADHDDRLSGMGSPDLTRKQLAVFRKIDQALQATDQAVSADPPQVLSRGYVGLFKKGARIMWVHRQRLEDHLQALHDENVFFAGSENKYGSLRQQYERTLMQFIHRVQPVAQEQHYRDKRDSILEKPEEALCNSCRDPKAIGNATKAALAVAVSGFLALAVVRDGMNTWKEKKLKLSFSTFFFLGALMWLMQSGGKFKFLGSDYFNTITSTHLSGTDGKDYAEQIMNLPPARANHAIALFDQDESKPITLDMLTNPKSSTGRALPNKAIDESLAKHLLAMPRHAAWFLLYNLRKARRPEEREAVLSYIKNNGNGQAGRELQTVMRTEDTSASSATP